MINAAGVLAQHAETAEMMRQRYESEGELRREFANIAAQELRRPEDAEFSLEIGNKSIELYGDDMTLMYQIHRLLLWAGDIDGARGLVQPIINSELPEGNKLLVQLRQACAEHGVRYTHHPTLRASIGAHFRFLRQMATPPPSVG